MVTLPLQVVKNNYTYYQVLRGPNKAIYSQHHGNTLIAYEVVKIRIHPSRFNHFLKREEPEKEQYPTNAQWGKFGWTCKSWQKSIEKYNQIK